MILRSCIALIVLALAFGSARADAPALGAGAPDLRLQDQEGRWHTLTQYRGNWVTLYFCPKNQTPSCTEQAGQFRDNAAAFRELNTVILSVSVDTVEAHKKFADRNQLPFPVLADPSKTAATSYGVLKAFPGAGDLARRDTFLIDPAGRIVKHYPNVDPKGHAQAVLEEIKRLQQQGGA